MFSKQKLLAFGIVAVFGLLFFSTQSVQAGSVFVFNKNLQTGSVNSDVKELQKFLNNNGFVLNQSGPGSLGLETTFFGSATRNALIKFQKVSKIAPAVGYFGPITRSAINKIVESSSASSSPLGKQIDSSPSVNQTNQNIQSSYSNYYPIVLRGGVRTASYSLIYTAGTGGTISGESSQAVRSGRDGTAVTAVPNTGYIFTGWSDGILTAERMDSSVASSKTVSATFLMNTYTVAFDTNGGDGGSTATQTLNYNTPTVLTTNGFTKTGNTFAGWATTTDGAVEYVDGASYTVGTGNVTLFAKWTIDTYTVAYDANGSSGGTKPDNQTKAYDTTLVLATNSGTLIKTGYTFSGWNTSADGTGTNYAVGANYTANTGVTLFAKWAPSLAVGNAYQGGRVAYILQSGDPGYVSGETHGIIASLGNLSTGIYWHAINSGTTGATGTAIGTGLSNTNTIVATYGAENNAAKLAYDYTNVETGTGVYSDWYLPSKDELNKLYLNKAVLDGSVNNFYWTSSELTSGLSWQQWLFSGGSDGGDKNTLFYVRAVRSF